MHNQEKRGKFEQQFKIIKEIGSGTFGNVLKCQSRGNNKIYAVKVISNISTTCDSIEQEAKAMKMVKSDFIIELFDFFYDQDYEGGSYIFVMPYCRNGSLSRLIKKQWKEEQILLFLYQITQAFLSIPRDQGYWHLDLKPDNILVKKNGEYLVCDFGCAKMVENPTLSRNLMLSMNKGVGTTAYAAPEIIIKFQSNKHSDIWSLGVILYEIIYHKHPLHYKQKDKEFNNTIGKFYDKQFKILYPEKEGYQKVIGIVQKMLRPKQRMDWSDLRKKIFYSLNIPPHASIVTSIDHIIKYLDDLVVILFGLIYYVEINTQYFLQIIKVEKHLIQSLTFSVKSFIFTALKKILQSVDRNDLKAGEITFFISRQTKNNYTLHQKEKLNHQKKMIEEYSKDIMEKSRFDDLVSARLYLEDSIQQFLEQSQLAQRLKSHPYEKANIILKILKFVKAKTGQVRNIEYKNRVIMSKFAPEIVYF